MITARAAPTSRRRASLALLAGLAITVSACTTAGPSRAIPEHPTAAVSGAHSTNHRVARGAARTHTLGQAGKPGPGLPEPSALTPFPGPSFAGAGTWHPAGRPVDGVSAVYATALLPPGGTQRAGIAWMDSKLLYARLYSGSLSPGGGPYKFTAPVLPAQAATLVAAFNGGFKMADAHGGYYTEGRMIDPLVAGDASLVIYANGSATVGAWDTDVSMTPNVVAVRQNLFPLVVNGHPVPLAADWRAWGDTCGAHSCASTVPGIEHQWRSGLGITADGALIYVVGKALAPLQLADLLAKAGAVRAMELDINPNWPVFVSYTPRTSRGLAAASNGQRLLSTTHQGPATFFEPSWARDFITMSARTAARP